MTVKQFRLHARRLAVLSIVLVAAGCTSDKSMNSKEGFCETVTVRVTPVNCVAINQVVIVSGALEADKTSPVSFLVPGKVNQILAEEGDHVVRGTIIATLEAEDYRNNLAIANAALFRAKDAFDRYEPLYKDGAFAEKDFIELKTGLAQALAANNIARKALADTRLSAPITGTISVKNIEVGQMAVPKEPVFSLVKTDVIFARVSVPETDIGQVAVNQGSSVTIPALENRKVSGIVTMVGTVADERTRSYPVKIKLSNSDFSLKPGMIVQAGIGTDTAVHLLNAVFSVQAEWIFCDFNRTRSRVARAESEKRAFDQRIRKVKDLIRLEIKAAFLNLKVAKNNIETAKTALCQARENLRITRMGYRQQAATSTEVLDARNDLTQAETNYHQALYGCLAALERAVGTDLGVKEAPLQSCL